jgi:hypothetical protein
MHSPLSLSIMSFCLLDLDAFCEMFTAVLSVTSIVTGLVDCFRPRAPPSSPGWFLCKQKKKSKLYGITCFLLLGWPLLSSKGFSSMRRFSRYLHALHNVQEPTSQTRNPDTVHENFQNITNSVLWYIQRAVPDDSIRKTISTPYVCFTHAPYRILPALSHPRTSGRQENIIM